METQSQDVQGEHTLVALMISGGGIIVLVVFYRKPKRTQTGK